MSTEAIANPFGALTKREREVARELAVGRKNREIAEQLQIALKTVDTHRMHLLEKVGVRNNVELARAALRWELVTL